MDRASVWCVVFHCCHGDWPASPRGERWRWATTQFSSQTHAHTTQKRAWSKHTHTKHIHSCIQQTARLTPKGRFIIEVLFQKGVFQLLVILLAPLQFEMNVLTLFAGQCASIIWKTCITVTLCVLSGVTGAVWLLSFLFPPQRTPQYSVRAPYSATLTS